MKKQKKYAGVVGVVLGTLALLFLLAWLGQRSVNNQPGAVTAATGNSVLIAAETVYDFGTISMAAGKVKHDFVIRNTGDSGVKVRKLYTSCMCTQATLDLNGQKFGPYGMPGHGVVPTFNATLPAQGEADLSPRGSRPQPKLAGCSRAC